MLKCDKCKKEIKNLKDLSILEWKDLGYGLGLYHQGCVPKRIFFVRAWPLDYRNLNIKREIFFRIIFAILYLLVPMVILVYGIYFISDYFVFFDMLYLFFGILFFCFFLIYLMPCRDIIKLLRLKKIVGQIPNRKS